MDLSSKIPHLITLTRDLSVAAVKETLKNITRKAIFFFQLFKGACLASEKKEKKTSQYVKADVKENLKKWC